MCSVSDSYDSYVVSSSSEFNQQNSTTNRWQTQPFPAHFTLKFNIVQTSNYNMAQKNPPATQNREQISWAIKWPVDTWHTRGGETGCRVIRTQHHHLLVCHMVGGWGERRSEDPDPTKYTATRHKQTNHSRSHGRQFLRQNTVVKQPQSSPPKAKNRPNQTTIQLRTNKNIEKPQIRP